MNGSEPRIKATVAHILTLLVARNYTAIEKFTNRTRLSEDQLRQAVSGYGRTLVMLPAWAFDQLDVIEVTGANPMTWSVRVDLWTVEEGRSDLSLECTLIDRPGEFLVAEIDNLHVL